MLNKLKEFLSEHKISVAVVGGTLVVATAWGSCTVDPADVEAVEAEEVSEVIEVQGQNTAETANASASNVEQTV
jgi:hypothetical protein